MIMDIFMIIFMVLAVLISGDSEHQILEIVRSTKKYPASSLCRKHGMRRAVLRENDVMELIAITRKNKLDEVIFYMKKDNVSSPFLLGDDTVFEPIPHSYEGNTGLCVPIDADKIRFIYNPMKRKIDFDKWFGRIYTLINFIYCILNIIKIMRQKEAEEIYKKKVKKYKKEIEKYKKEIEKFKKEIDKYTKKIEKYKKKIEKFKKR